MFTEKVH